MVVATMGSSLQIELPARFLACEALEEGYLHRFEDKLPLW